MDVVTGPDAVSRLREAGVPEVRIAADTPCRVGRCAACGAHEAWVYPERCVPCLYAEAGRPLVVRVDLANENRADPSVWERAEDRAATQGKAAQDPARRRARYLRRREALRALRAAWKDGIARGELPADTPPPW